jgi:flagellar protein FliS
MNAYEKMKESSIQSMSQGELLVRLYDELLKDIRKSEFALDDKDYEMFDFQIDYCQRIIRYLMNTLDMSQPVSYDLRRLYVYLQYDFGRLRAARGRMRDELPEIEIIVKDLRDGFDGASHSTVDTHMPAEQRVVV